MEIKGNKVLAKVKWKKNNKKYKDYLEMSLVDRLRIK